jgi:ankyrin repeat protein
MFIKGIYVEDDLNDIDYKLVDEFYNNYPNKENIEKYILEGANINCIVYGKENLLMQLISRTDDKNNFIKSSYDIINFVIKKGANINYIRPDTGFNCLFQAVLAQRADIVELLLKSGANPNCISIETPESLYDWVDWDVHFEELEKRLTEDEMKNYFYILELFEDYGGKTLEELNTNKIDDYLIICDSFENGLVTKDGNIKIEHIINDYNIVLEFNEWILGDYSPYQLCHKINDKKYTIELLIEHINNGLKYSNYIKKALPENIKLFYYAINYEIFKQNNSIDIKEYII